MDLKKKVFGDKPSADELHFMRCRDAKSGFMVDTRVNDAFRNGYIFVNPAHEKPAQKYYKTIRMSCKFAISDGWCSVLHLDGATPELKKALPPKAISLGIQCLPVFKTGLGGITRFDKDPATGMPTVFYYSVYGADGQVIPIDASRCTIITWGDENPGWQGYTGLGRLLDPATGLRMWLGAAIRRQRDYPTTRYLMPLPDSCFLDGALKPSIKVTLDAVFMDIPYLVVPGKPGEKYEPTTIGGPIETDEESLVVDQSNKDSAVSGAVSQSDMTGTQAGQKLGNDADTATYFMTAKDIQQEFLPFVKEIFEKLAMPIDAFKPASELPAVSKHDEFIKLADLYSRAPPSIQAVTGEIIQDLVSREFGKMVIIDAEGDNQAIEERAQKIFGGKNDETSVKNNEKDGKNDDDGDFDKTAGSSRKKSQGGLKWFQRQKK